MDTASLPIDTLPLLTQLLRQSFGSQIEIEGWRIAKQHEDYFVLVVELRQPSSRIVVKLAGPRAPYACLFDRTATLHRLVAARTAVPIPEILAVDVSYNMWPWRYIIESFVPGETWMTVRQRINPQELADSYSQIGAAVAELHAIHFPQFGELSKDGTTHNGTNKYLAALTTRMQQSIRSPRLVDLFLALLETNTALFEGIYQASLCHEDLHGHNILFEQVDGRWRLAAILDFDKAWAGHHEIDLARMELWSMAEEGFWAGYNARYDDSYERRRPIYQLLWCLEYAVATPRHLADTQRLCKELGLPLLQNFK